MTSLRVSLVVLAVFLEAAYGRCPNDYYFHSGDKRCYRAVASLKTWPEARKICLCDGGDLVTISAEVNPVAGPDILRSQGKEYWMGLNDRNEEGTFKWNNAKDNATYFKWATSHPLSGAEGEAADCTAIIRTGLNSFKWVNQKCSTKNYFVCGRLSDEDMETYLTENAAKLNVTCPADNDDWVRVPNRRLCVMKIETAAEWLEAFDWCYEFGYGHPGKSNLLNVADFELNDYIEEKYGITKDYWIAPTDYSNEGVYTNTVMRGARVLKYLPWKPGTTRAEDKDCVLLTPGEPDEENKIIDEKCHKSYSFMCQWVPPPPPRPVREKTCPQGWRKFAPSETCFKVMGDKRQKWKQARDGCKEMDADLAAIPNQETLDFIQELAATDRYWIGLRDKDKDGTFTWLGQDTEPEFQAWNNPPRNLMGDEYCVEMIGPKGGRWNDKSCKAKKLSICEKPAKVQG